jgi:hypothetical protein
MPPRTTLHIINPINLDVFEYPRRSKYPFLIGIVYNERIKPITHTMQKASAAVPKIVAIGCRVSCTGWYP